MFFGEHRTSGFAGKAAVFAIGALLGAAAMEAASYAHDPCARRAAVRKGKRLYRLARAAAERIL